MKILAIDIGNTNITVGFFSGKRLVRKAKIPTGESSAYARRLTRFVRGCAVSGIDRVIVASVVPEALAALQKTLGRLGAKQVLVTGRTVAIPIRNRYRDPKEVGQDRLVDAYAVRELYGAPAVVIDFGTAVTFDIISRKGEYLGGLILPGIGISLASLYEKTALLPRVALKPARDIIARDTVNSMRGGILFGFGAMCDGLIGRYRKILGKDMRVVVTGGNAGLVRKYIESAAIVDEDMTLKGLMLLSDA